MDHLDDSENNAKISDSAYSISCSNSQSRRSHSSKSTHSGSNSSGSSGYSGKPSTSGSSNNLGQPPKKETENKKKKQPQIEAIVLDVIVESEARGPEPGPAFDAPVQEDLEAVPNPPSVHSQSEKGVENIYMCSSELQTLKEEVVSCNPPVVSVASKFPSNCTLPATVPPERYQEIGRYEMQCENTENMRCEDGFSCVISMHDGVVMYTTSSLTTTLGFPKDMWIGRSFIDFIHPRDRSTFASQITNGLTVPKNENNGMIETAQSPANMVSNMVCRIRRYRGLTSGFGVKDKTVSFMPFLLKLTFKNISDDESKVIYLVIQATPFFSAFKTPNEVVIKAVPFVLRHAASGHIKYVDPESVPYLGYLPQDLSNKEALQLYHPEDLHYIHEVFDTIVKEGGFPRSKPYRMLTQNGDYLRLETEWSSFINPWSKKLEFVIGKNHIIEGPMNPDVFQLPDKTTKVDEAERNRIQNMRDAIIRTLNEVLTKPAEVAKQQMSKRCQDVASFMESQMEETPKTDEELRLEIQDADHSYYERDSVMLGGISPHHDYFANDSKSSTETPLSYNQLNYNETMQRFFDNHQPLTYEDYNPVTGENTLGLKDASAHKTHCPSPVAQYSLDSMDMSCSSDSNEMISLNSPLPPLDVYQPIRLTESVLSKHNSKMEKELLNINREARSSSKGGKEKKSNEMRRKKKEHMARCNAAYQPTSDGVSKAATPGTKRASKHLDGDMGKHKHHCPSPRSSRHKQRILPTSTAVGQPAVSKAVTRTMDTSHWVTAPVNNMNAFNLGVGIPQLMSIASPISSLPTVPGMANMPGIANMQRMPNMQGMANMPCMANMPGMAHMPGAHMPGAHMPGAHMPGAHMPVAHMPGPHMPGAQMPGAHMPVAHMPGPHMPGAQMPGPHMAGAHMSGMTTMPVMQGMPGMPGMFPMYYVPTAYQPMPSSSAANPAQVHHFQAPAMMMYGQPMYPYMYSPINPHLYPMQQTHMMAQSTQNTNSLNPLGLTSSNYQEACKPGITLRPGKVTSVWRDSIRAESHRLYQESGYSHFATNALNRESAVNDSHAGNGKSTKYSTDIRSPSISNIPKSTEPVPNTPPWSRVEKLNKIGNSDESPDKTDGESSYSSFYSSFFKTESGSAEESGDSKFNKEKRLRSPLNTPSAYYQQNPVKRVARRKMEPPWMEQVCVTSELIYKYQVHTKNVEEVLSSDKQKLQTLEQPALVNEQLGQLYLDLQLEGVASRLTLEEGITSSSSSGEETTSTKKSRKRREYSKLVIIHEEDAPLPPPDAEA